MIKRTFEFMGSGVIYSLDFTSPRGRMLAIGADNEGLVIDVNGGENITRFTDHSDSILDVKFAEKNRYILSGDKNDQIKLWRWYEKDFLSKNINKSSINENKIIEFKDPVLEAGIRKKLILAGLQFLLKIFLHY
ncbi:MAG: WD40 repeat domain-containing protein [Halanaerobium sp.]